MLQLSKMILEGEGYKVYAARTPGEAVRIAEQDKSEIDLLLTDVVMPEMNGRELVERLRVMRPDLKYIYMSGYTADVIAHRGILEEDIGFIQKPFQRNEILSAVRKALEET